MALNIALGVVIGVPLGVGIFFLLRFLRHRALVRSLQTSLLLIKVPQDLAGEGRSGAEKDFKTEINFFEQLLGNLASQKQGFVFEAAVHHIGEEIHFYLAVPKRAVEVASKQIQGLWNGASVEEVKGDYNIFNPQGAVAAAYLLQKENYAL
ncbi:MAG: hypothetical protein AAB967_01050, partial [Patescibacteria group bacterium]